jgi:pyridinium-3,5-biscarboxylic acid mononucleotide synthase
MSKHFNIDHTRDERVGFQEIVFGASKSVDQLRKIINDFLENNKSVLCTKVQKKKAKVLITEFSESFYDQNSKILLVGKFPSKLSKDEVAILSGGTSDQYLVNEIYFTLKFFGKDAERFQDIGVAGVHRLLNNLEKLKKFKVVIVIAGFEGALPTVTGGLLSQPIIAVPAAVGYGISRGGKVALNSMLSSCANGITVVNIDNGYGAAMAALRILNLQLKK